MTSDIATIMVVVDGDYPSDTQLQNVGGLAAELGARIIGVTASEHTPSFYFAAGAVETNLLAEDERRMKERMAAAEKRCRKALEGCSASVTWRSAVDLPIDFVLRESRAADLLVCFSRRTSSLFSDAEEGELVLKSGRPLLVVPGGAKWRSPKRILIGWKDSRESRRAVRDALPFLRRARKVNIVEIVEGDENPKAAEARLRDVVSWLKAHSVEALPQVVTPRKDAIVAFAGAVREFNPDWIVAGAYGHSRLGEWIFGGMTRHLLMQSDRPALLSH
jgi:nucleotide-binding universal stress UspA family protein